MHCRSGEKIFYNSGDIEFLLQIALVACLVCSSYVALQSGILKFCI